MYRIVSNVEIAIGDHVYDNVVSVVYSFALKHSIEELNFVSCILLIL